VSSCEWSDELGVVVHSYPPGLRTCFCGWNTVPDPVSRWGWPRNKKRRGNNPEGDANEDVGEQEQPEILDDHPIPDRDPVSENS
jgi:hypothetical protein